MSWPSRVVVVIRNRWRVAQPSQASVISKAMVPVAALISPRLLARDKA